VIRSCKCWLYTDVNDVIVNRLGHHTHGSDAAGVEVAKIKANTKHRALDTMELPSQFHSSPGYNGTRLKRELGVVHPSIWKFTDGLRRVQKGRDVTYEQYIRGEPGPVKRRENILADQLLLTTVNDYNNRDIIEYLRGIAHNFLMEQTANFLVQNFSTIWKKFFQEVEESLLRLILNCSYEFEVFVFNCKMSIMI